MSIKVTNANFETEVLKSSVPVLIDFWAPWCGPCKAIGPRIDELAEEVEGAAAICKINVDEETALAQKFGVMSIPTLIVFKEGREIGRVVGVKSKEELRVLLGV